jgi:hypothetical protein
MKRTAIREAVAVLSSIKLETTVSELQSNAVDHSDPSCCSVILRVVDDPTTPRGAAVGVIDVRQGRGIGIAVAAAVTRLIAAGSP